MAGVLIERGAPNSSINSSTGKQGLTRRSFNRAYDNAGSISGTDALIDSMRGAKRLSGVGLRTDGRAVVRGFVPTSVIDEVLLRREDRLSSNLEVAVPVGEEWYTVWARNGRKRRPIVPVKEMVEATSEYDKSPHTARENMEKVLNQGFTFVSDVGPKIEGQLLELWGKTFGWTQEQIQEFTKNLRQEKMKSPQERTMWFTGVMEGDKLIAANMAERANISSAAGNINVVESTEWKVRETVYGEFGEVIEEGYEGRGLMQAAVSVTNVQVLEDLGIDNTFIYAECNFAKRADIAAQRAGMSVPPRHFELNGSGNIKVADQVMIGNVGVNDGIPGLGYPMEEGNQQFELRDFIFTHLDPKAIRDYYGFEDRFYVMSHLGERRDNREVHLFSVT